jgi:hypothetical protein
MSTQTVEGEKLETEIRALKTDAKRAQAIGSGAALVGILTMLIGGASEPFLVASVAAFFALASVLSVFRKVRDENALKEKQNAFLNISDSAPEAVHHQ